MSMRLVHEKEQGRSRCVNGARGRKELRAQGKYEEAKKLELNALWALPVAWHPYSQRMNLKHGWHPCGIALGVFSPARLGTAQAARSSTRITAMMHMLPLDAASPITASVPERIAPIVNAIYKAQGRTVTIDTTPVPPGTAEATGTIAHTLNTTLNWVNLAVIQAPRILQDTLPRLEEAVAVMETHSSAEAISIDLPITDPACAWVGDALMERGFVLGGIGPRFLGEDALRLQKPIAPCQREGLAIEGELSNRIAEEALRALPPDQVPSHA